MLRDFPRALTRRAATGLLPLLGGSRALAVEPPPPRPGTAIVSVRDEGARGDLRSDDSDALERAATRALAEGRDILVEPGTYRTTRPWLIGARIVGDEMLAAPATVNPFDNAVREPLRGAYRPSVLADGALLVGDFDEGAVLYYGLDTDLGGRRVGASVLRGLTVYGRACLKGQALAPPPPETMPGPSRQTGVLALNGLARVERLFARDVATGLLTKWCFWTVTEQATFLRCGLGLDAREANAQTFRGVVCRHSAAGARIAGDAWRLDGFHTENVRRDLDVGQSQNAVVGPCYLEDAASGADEEDFFVRLGGDGAVSNCTLQGVRTAGGKARKPGWLIGHLRASALIGCRRQNERVVVDDKAASATLIGCDFGPARDLGPGFSGDER